MIMLQKVMSVLRKEARVLLLFQRVSLSGEKEEGEREEGERVGRGGREREKEEGEGRGRRRRERRKRRRESTRK
jgi:hypothetical protein